MRNVSMGIITFVTLAVMLSSQLGSLLSGRASTSSDLRGMKRTTLQKAVDEEPARIWEEAIAAKRGRERLYSVRNLVVRSRGEYLTQKMKKNEVRMEEIYVLPSKLWSWSDYRPDV